jgi:malonyl CoA-acyl carrier protein transacylase
MREPGKELSRFIAKLPFRDPETPLVSTLSARVLTSAEEVRQELADQMCAAVQWARCVAAMANEGVGNFIEVGPGHALTRMVSRIRDDAKAVSAEEASAAEMLELTESRRGSRIPRSR